MSGNGTAVLLLAHGTPACLEDIPDYMRNVTGGRAIPDSVIEEVRHRYGLIGRSPLTDITLRQGELLAEQLGLPVYVGMRNWKPYISETVRLMREDGVERMIAICLAPQNSRTSVGLYRSATMAQADGITTDFVESWHDHPLLIEAFAEKLRMALQAAGGEAAVVFTAHSVPCHTIAAGDPYEKQTRETAALVSRKLALPHSQWAFAFQSQGMSGGPWLGPTVEETLRRLKDAGRTQVIIHPVGFVCDHVEVLYDIDIAFRELGREMGLTILRPESLNDSPKLIAALADLARSRLETENNSKTKGSTTDFTDVHGSHG